MAYRALACVGSLMTERSTFDGPTNVTCPSSHLAASEVISCATEHQATRRFTHPRPCSMTRHLIFRIDDDSSSSQGPDSSDEDMTGYPSTCLPSYHLESTMYLERQKIMDVSLDLDLFVFDLSEDDHNAKAERVGIRGRKKGSAKRSSPPVRSISPPSYVKQRRRSEASNSRSRRPLTVDPLETERGRTKPSGHLYDTVGSLTSAPTHRPRRENQSDLGESRTVEDSPTQSTSQSTIREDSFNKVLRYTPMPSILVKPQSDNLMQPNHPPSSPLRLRFVEAPGPSLAREQSSSTITFSAPLGVAPSTLTKTGEGDEKLVTRRASFVLGPPPASMSPHNTEPPQDAVPSRGAMPTTTTSTMTTGQTTAVAPIRRSSSSNLFLPRLLSSNLSSPTSPTMKSSATPTVRLCKVCATYHKIDGTEKSKTAPGSASASAEASLSAGTGVDTGEEDEEQATSTVNVNDTPRRLSLPDFTSSAAQSAGKFLITLGTARGRARSQSDTRALLESIQAAGRQP